MIGRRRQSEPSNPRKAAEAEAKAAKREAFIVSLVQLSLRAAKVHEHLVGGGTLLTEPVLVFYGKHRQDVRVFDQHCKQLGVARWSQDKTAKLEGYGIYGMDDEVPLVAINWRPPGWLSGRGDYRFSDSEGIEIATLSARETYNSAQAIMVGAERIGYLKPPGRKPWHIEDNEGREVARIQSRTPCHVTEIGPSLAGPLRKLAIVASIIVKTPKPRH